MPTGHDPPVQHGIETMGYRRRSGLTSRLRAESDLFRGQFDNPADAESCIHGNEAVLDAVAERNKRD